MRCFVTVDRGYDNDGFRRELWGTITSWLQQLKKGKIQYTDSSNALRLMRKHGEDIRYNAA